MVLKERVGKRLEEARIWDRESNRGHRRTDFKNSDVLLLKSAGYSGNSICRIFGIAASTLLDILDGTRKDQLEKPTKKLNGKKLCSCCGCRQVWGTNRFLCRICYAGESDGGSEEPVWNLSGLPKR
jgi:hypothetical protein